MTLQQAQDAEAIRLANAKWSLAMTAAAERREAKRRARVVAK